MPSENHSRLFEVTTKDLEGLPDARGESVRSMLKVDHGIEVFQLGDTGLSRNIKYFRFRHKITNLRPIR